ncbi:MAG: hypothetical protein K0R49_1767, partial [Burkholderiales bacterium]|nr:hypothetical protein [Burkholderiales bacterium]
IEGKIEGNTISVTLPFWVNLKEAVAKFNSVGKVTVNGAPQKSGETSNDFTNSENVPLNYIVTAADNSTRTYFIKVNISTWKWKSGSDTPGVIGTIEKGPGGRFSGATWTDKNGNFLLFGGGTKSGSLRDLWMWNKDAQAWQFLGKKGQNPAETFVYGIYPAKYGDVGEPGSRVAAMTWRDNNGEFWMFGGVGLAAREAGSFSSGNLNDLWKLSFTGTEWEWKWMGGAFRSDMVSNYGERGLESATNMPGSRRYGASWTDQNGDLWMFGGENTNGADLVYHNDLWRYSIARKSWTWIKGSKLPNQTGRVDLNPDDSNPGARSQAVTWVDAHGDLWLFGGYSWDASTANSNRYYSDLWKFNVKAQRWTLVKGTVDSAGNVQVNERGVYGSMGIGTNQTTPGSRYNSVSWIDEDGNLWLHGGQGASSSKGIIYELNDLWKFNPSDSKWTWMGGSAIPDNQAFKANAAGIYYGDAWKLRPGSREGSHSWADNKGNLWMFGGSGYGKTVTTDAFGSLNDLWVYNYK